MNLLGFSQVPVTDIAHAIQLSLAPVFLLNGVGVLLSMLTARLARIVDRARGMEQRQPHAGDSESREIVAALAVIRQRSRLMYLAIALGTIAALLVALVVAVLFAAAFATVSLAGMVSVLFILSMLSLISALVCFLAEIKVATASLRIGQKNL